MAGSDSGTTGGSGGDTSGSGGSSGDVGTAGTAGSAGASVGGASAGSGGASAGAGAGGTSSSGTGGGGGGGMTSVPNACVHTGPRTLTNLTPTNGNLTCTTNDFGIEGDWKLNSSDPQLMTTSFTGATVCASGTIAQVVSTATSGGLPDYGRYWGGGIAFPMNEVGGNVAPYDATLNGLSGISATISGATIPAQMRFKFKMIGVNDSFCVEVDGATSGQNVVLHTADAKHNCWSPDTALTLDPTMIENYEVQVVSQSSKAVPFDFCLTNITAIPL
jgi:hypothetical protein